MLKMKFDIRSYLRSFLREVIASGPKLNGSMMLGLEMKSYFFKALHDIVARFHFHFFIISPVVKANIIVWLKSRLAHQCQNQKVSVVQLFSSPSFTFSFYIISNSLTFSTTRISICFTITPTYRFVLHSTKAILFPCCLGAIVLFTTCQRQSCRNNQ